MNSTWRLFWRDLRAGEFTLLLMALILAVAATTTLRFFSSSLQQALSQQASSLLGADVVLSSSRPLRGQWPQLATQLQLQQTQVVEFSTVAQYNEGFQLSAIKAVAAPYPLRGTLQIDQKTFSNQISVPQQGSVWVEPRLLALLNAPLGSVITLGEAQFTIDADMGGGFSAFSPKILMNLADVPATNAVQQGSRVNYRLLVAGDSANIKQFSSQAKEQLQDDERLRDMNNASRQLSKPLVNANNYLSLASIAAVLLAGIAVALAAQRFALRHFDSLALMRCFGTSKRQLWLLDLVGSHAVRQFNWWLRCVVIVSSISQFVACQRFRL